MNRSSQVAGPQTHPLSSCSPSRVIHRLVCRDAPSSSRCVPERRCDAAAESATDIVDHVNGTRSARDPPPLEPPLSRLLSTLRGPLGRCLTPDVIEPHPSRYMDPYATTGARIFRTTVRLRATEVSVVFDTQVDRQFVPRWWVWATIASTWLRLWPL